MHSPYWLVVPVTPLHFTVAPSMSDELYSTINLTSTTPYTYTVFVVSDVMEPYEKVLLAYPYADTVPDIAAPPRGKVIYPSASEMYDWSPIVTVAP